MVIAETSNLMAVKLSLALVACHFAEKWCSDVLSHLRHLIIINSKSTHSAANLHPSSPNRFHFSPASAPARLHPRRMNE